MSTRMTRSESARFNGAKSQGPKTPEGLSISSMNALDHGITARTLILQNEDPDKFAEMQKALFDHLQPANQVEIDLVTDIVAARWRLNRIWRYETALLDIEMDSQAPDFEKRFEGRAKLVENMPGFIRLEILRPLKSDYYVVLTPWQDETSFRSWADSAEFKEAHNKRSPAEIFAGPNVFEMHEVIQLADKPR